VPDILNNEKVFAVFQGDLVTSTFFLASGRLVGSGIGWLTYVYEPLA
jgi:hypothetical protein